MLKWMKKEIRKALMIDPELHSMVKIWCAQNKILIKDFTENALKREMIRENNMRKEVVK